jgi:hypothetical protein
MGSSLDGWEAFGSSVRGVLHTRSGQPNQDSLQVWTDLAIGHAVVAVADGHGGASHPRSDVGARLATETAVATLRACLSSGSLPAASAQKALVEAIGAHWQRAVAAHFLQTPLTGERRGLESGLERGRDPAIAYGTTMLAAAATPGWVLLLQLGDGDILTVSEQGDTRRPLPDDPRLVGGQTLSLCQPAAWREARTIALEDDEMPVLVLLSSDGYANSFQTDADFLAIGADYLSLLRTGVSNLRDRLPRILGDASADGSGDDITLGLLHRSV